MTPDGRSVVSGSNDKTVRVWELESGRLLRTLKGHTSRVNSVSVTPDGQSIISGSDDKTVRVRELDSGRLLRTLEGHAGPVYSVAVHHVSVHNTGFTSAPPARGVHLSDSRNRMGEP